MTANYWPCFKVALSVPFGVGFSFLFVHSNYRTVYLFSSLSSGKLISPLSCGPNSTIGPKTSGLEGRERIEWKRGD